MTMAVPALWVVAVGSLGLGPWLPRLCAQTASVDALVQCGRYRDVPAAAADDHHGQAAWAFAQFHLAPTREVADAAERASSSGEPLAMWVWIRCLAEGIGTRHDVAQLWRWNHALRQQLVGKTAPSPIELYLLQSTGPQDEHGETHHREGSVEQDQKAERKRREEWLLAAARGGMAQAENDLGLAAQAGKDFAAAFAHFRRAAELGLAAGMKNQAFLWMQGAGVARDPAAAFALNVRAAEAGDAFAAISAAASCSGGWGTDQDPVLARRWLDQAAATGHWAALLERGMAALKGTYGCARDPAAARRDFALAAATRSAAVMSRLAAFHATGEGVAADGDRAVAFAEVAFVQGSEEACYLLRNVYKEGIAGIERNDAMAEFWSACAQHGLAALPTQLLEDPAMRAQAQRLRTLDPWSVKVDD